MTSVYLERIPMELPEFESPRPEGMRVLRLQLSVLVIIYTLAVYTGIYALTRTLVFDSLRAQGESYFALVVDMRAWNAARGAVWVPKTSETTTNPFLEKIGIKPDIRTEDGTVLTMRNPSAMTREVSDLTRQRSGVSFHLTSLDYLNPTNAPDAWEKSALTAFADGELSRYGVNEIDGVRHFRYAAPLRVDATCLGCHSAQNYSVGDERGAITVSIPMADTDALLLRAAAFLAGMTVLTLAGALMTLYLLAIRTEHRLTAANEQLTRIALTDALTGLLNRGATFARLEQEYVRARRTGADLSVVMLDIDHFKQVNDTYGHGAGDCT
ncbi:DUF3365 domain-containing protein, partial [bacterium]|nr:DUF3365 domain-containing protein [bacterium]